MKFDTQKLPAAPDATAPDGSDVRILLGLQGGGMAHFELQPGHTSKAVGELLIKRGSAMGPLVLPLLLSLVFLFFAWLFRSTFVISGFPIFSAVLIILVLGIVIDYHRRYAFFAKNDPDKLQSEEYRYKTARMQMIASGELHDSIPEEELPEAKEKPDALEPSSEEDEPSDSTDTDEEKTA